jgi:hypothetical protein
MSLEQCRINVENIDTALDGIDEMAAKLRELSDAGSKMGDDLTRDMHSMSHEERFDATLDLWRQFSKIGVAVMWLELHARTARRNNNTLLSELPEEV